MGQFSNGTNGKESQFLQFCDSTTFFFANDVKGLFIIGDIYGEGIIELPPSLETDSYAG